MKTIEERARAWAETFKTGEWFENLRIAGYILGATEQDALRSEEVEKLKADKENSYTTIMAATEKIRELRSRLSSLTAISNKMDTTIEEMLNDVAQSRENLELIRASYASYKNSLK